MRLSLKFILIVLLPWTITACIAGDFSLPQSVTQIQSPLPTPGKIVYVRTGQPRSLMIVDTASWQVVRQVSLPNSWADHMDIDPLGRIWIGYSGGHGWSDNRVQVFAPDGSLIRTLRPCSNPDNGVMFARGKVFIICEQNGFRGRIIALDLNTFDVKGETELFVPNNNYLMVTAAGNADTLVVTGMNSGPIDTAYNTITIIDTESLAIKAQFGPFAYTQVVQVLERQGTFYLLNSASLLSTTEKNDILLVKNSDSASISTNAAPTAAPTYGAIQGNLLYSYHNPTRGDIHITTPLRAMSRLNLETGASQTWELPDNWDATDLEIIDGKIVLAFPGGSSMFTTITEAGLYEFDPQDGQLHLLVAIPKAARIAVPK